MSNKKEVCHHCFGKMVTYKVKNGYSQLPMKMPKLPFTYNTIITDDYFLVECPYCKPKLEIKPELEKYENKDNCQHNDLFLELCEQLYRALHDSKNISKQALVSDKFYCEKCNSKFTLMFGRNIEQDASKIFNLYIKATQKEICEESELHYECDYCKETVEDRNRLYEG